MDALRIRIGPVVERAEKLAALVLDELPGHAGILRAAEGVAAAASEAERVSLNMRRVFSPHRLPALFLGLALVLFLAWCYWYFFHVSRLTVALPERDAVQLHERVAGRSRVLFRELPVQGSNESARLVAEGRVDLAFVQGGVSIPAELHRVETPRSEFVLFFLREGISGPESVHRVLTSVENAGSHHVARDFFAAWGLAEAIEYVFDWTRLTSEPEYRVPEDVDCVFVVKDPSNQQALDASQRLARQGFRLAAPELGARVLRFDYLRPAEIPPAYLALEPRLPDEPVASYTVSTFLVARQGLRPRLLGQAVQLIAPSNNQLTDVGFTPDVGSASELLQGMDAFIGILAYIGLAFLALLGVEIMTYRRRFSDLDSLISLISMHQSNKDVLGIRDPAMLRENLKYLSICSDLLGLISVIAGYYSQENASLLYNNLLTIVHDRSSSLKLNIQLKILHGSVDAGSPELLLDD